MAFRLTILADKPDGACGVDETGFIAAAAQRIANAPHVVRARTVIDVDLALNKAEIAAQAAGEPLHVQIVGHGSSGQLLLGMTWLTEDVARQFPFFVIDTNPVALGFFRGHRKKLASLSLIGCYVGSVENSDVSDLAVNGRSLTYVLCELLQCPVSASIDLVAETDFDPATGTYLGELAGWRWQDGAAPTWAPAVHEEVDAVGSATPLEIDRIHHTFLLVKNPGPREIQNARAEVVPIDQPKLTWATPEMTVNVKDRGFASLIANGRYLVMGDKQYAVTNREELNAALRAPYLG